MYFSFFSHAYEPMISTDSKWWLL